MQIDYDPDGKAFVSRYEVGDLVRLRLDERGDGAMGKIGDWGTVISIETSLGNRLNIQLAGYSERKHSTLQRLLGIPKNIVAPCDRNGIPVALPSKTGLRDIESDLTRKIGRRR